MTEIMNMNRNNEKRRRIVRRPTVSVQSKPYRSQLDFIFSKLVCCRLISESRPKATTVMINEDKKIAMVGR